MIPSHVQHVYYKIVWLRVPLQKNLGLNKATSFFPSGVIMEKMRIFFHNFLENANVYYWCFISATSN